MGEGGDGEGTLAVDDAESGGSASEETLHSLALAVVLLSSNESAVRTRGLTEGISTADFPRWIPALEECIEGLPCTE